MAAAGNIFLDGYNTGDSYNPASVQLAGTAEYVAIADIGIVLITLNTGFQCTCKVELSVMFGITLLGAGVFKVSLAYL